MSEEELLTGKAKKAKRSEERHKKSKKRKRDDPAAAADPDEAIEPEIVLDSAPTPRADDRPKKSRKRKHDAEEPTPAADAGEKRKKKKRSKSAAADTEPAAAAEQTAEDSTTTPAPAAGGKQRFICFIGNLPYSATTASITKHFASLSPTSVRHRTDRATGRSKGFAFLEFAEYDRMKTCLKLMHHSTFDSGVAGEKKRRINVQLTAGGGGNSEGRKEKLVAKNDRLEEQRKRRAEAEAKQEERKERKGKKDKDGEKGGEKKAVEEKNEGGMHPARLAMIHNGR